MDSLLETSGTFNVARFTSTGSLVSRAHAPCSLGDGLDDDKGLGGGGEGGCLTHELSPDSATESSGSGLLTWRSIVRRVDGLDNAQSSMLLGRVDVDTGVWTPGNSLGDPLQMFDAATVRGNMSDVIAFPLKCNDGTTTPDAQPQDWSHCNAASVGIAPDGTTAGFVLGLRSLSSVAFMTRESSGVGKPTWTLSGEVCSNFNVFDFT